MKPSLIIIEGNISAGKSTLTRDLAQSLGYEVFLEPTQTNPYLAKFYQDPKAYALKMQVYLLRRRFHTYIAAIRSILKTGRGAVLDRSIFSDWVFAEKNRVDGNIDSDGFWYYSQLRERMLEGLPFPHMTIYLDVSPELCHQRIHGVRKRAAEVESGGIPLDYLRGLDDCYTRFLEQMTGKGSRVIRVDWSHFGDVRDIERAMELHADAHDTTWDHQMLTEIIGNDVEIKSRMVIRKSHIVVHEEDEDQDNVFGIDLDKSNCDELSAMTTVAPASPQDESKQ